MSARARYADPDLPLVRVAICGSVDSGKSTLLGRLVLDADLVFDDERPREGNLDLAMLADGLEAETEQGITIDVAYRHFATEQRTYLFADAPGHLQYTRNMATAASLATVAIVVVDAVVGITEQTGRHLAVCAAMGVRTIIVAINKVDEIGFDVDAVATLERAVAERALRLGLAAPVTIPIAARDGDNVTQRSSRTPWHVGPTLVEALDAAPTDSDEQQAAALRFPVRIILRPDNGERWIAGTIASGSLSVGQEIGIVGRPLRHGGLAVHEIQTARGPVPTASADTAVRIRLDGHLDVSSGDVICDPTDVEQGLARGARARLVWFHDLPLDTGKRYVVRAGTRWMFARVTRVERVLDLASLEPITATTVAANDIADVELDFAQAIPLDTFAEHRETGSFILVDAATGETVAAGMVAAVVPAVRNAIREEGAIGRDQRAQRHGHRGAVAWFTGLSGAGKSTITRQVEAQLHDRGYNVFVLAGDNLRLGLCGDLGFSPEDRSENLRRAAEVARLMLDAGLIVLCEFISPMEIDRREARRIVGDADFLEIFVHATVEECIARDPKGLYRRAIAGEIPDFTGISSPYEPPVNADLNLATGEVSIDSCADAVVRLILDHAQPLRVQAPASSRISSPR